MRKTALAAAAVLLFFTWASGQDAVPPDSAGREAAGGRYSYARLSFVDGRIFLQRAADLASEEATINTPISEGDRLGTDEGRAEISFGDIKYARLDHYTKIDVQTLPRDHSSLLRLRHWAGNLYLDLGSLDREKDVELLTPGATLYFLEKGLYRVDVGNDGRTEILVFEGLVETAAEEGSVLVKTGQGLSLADGRFEGRAKNFMTGATDAFDRWNGDRASLVRGTAESLGRLPVEIAEYESELDASGEWIDIEPFGFVWIPTGLSPGWRPYTWGRWTWLPFSGWCWVPYEPWGWCTFHYGRWQWDPFYGWYWIPLPGWGAAWVNWWWNDYYCGWAPMSYWGYPGIIYNNDYYGRGWDGDYPPESRALVVVRKSQLRDPNAGQAALPPGEIRSVGRFRLSETPPDFKPDPNAPLRLEPLDKRGAVLIRKDGGQGLSGNVPPESPRLIRPADRPWNAGSEKELKTPEDSRPVRIAERPGTAPDSSRPAEPQERRIRKTYPSFDRFDRGDSGKRESLTDLLRDKFYRVFQGEERKADSPSSKSGSVSGRRSSPRSSEGSASRSSGRSSSPSRSSSPPKSSSGNSSSGSSGNVKKK
ncbi:MAG TPA: hypothetical protein PKI53_06700 [Candidatus Aminicenantes bacterium]|nr:hypothetical protein [Acidobacteriota bacterium]HNQ80780.1 hypothetical protein [Candidatus Aminicenantes bacterium]HOU48052.1 hypothetical protein [Candidatus Aminicenantes bacterium]